MSNFNERTALNYKLRQDALTTAGRARMARQRIRYRQCRTAFRGTVATVAANAALIAIILTSSVISLAVWLS